MEVKKYNPFVVIKPKPKPTGSTRERSSKVRPKAKIKLEAGGLSLEKKLDIIYARVLLRQVRNTYQELLGLPRTKSVCR